MEAEPTVSPMNLSEGGVLKQLIGLCPDKGYPVTANSVWFFPYTHIYIVCQEWTLIRFCCQDSSPKRPHTWYSRCSAKICFDFSSLRCQTGFRHPDKSHNTTAGPSSGAFSQHWTERCEDMLGGGEIHRLWSQLCQQLLITVSGCLGCDFFWLCSCCCENAHTTGFSTWPKELEWWGILVRPTPGLWCSLAIKWHLYIWSQKWNLHLLSPHVFTSFSIPLSPYPFRKWIRLLVTSPDHLWEWISAWKELCDSWMEDAVGTEILIKLLNSAVGFTQSAANDFVLCTPPSNQRDRHDPYLCLQGCLAKEQRAKFIKLRKLLEKTGHSLVVLWGSEPTESHLPWPITTILSGTWCCCFIWHMGLILVLLVYNGIVQWGHFIS